MFHYVFAQRGDSPTRTRLIRGPLTSGSRTDSDSDLIFPGAVGLTRTRSDSVGLSFPPGARCGASIGIIRTPLCALHGCSAESDLFLRGPERVEATARVESSCSPHTAMIGKIRWSVADRSACSKKGKGKGKGKKKKGKSKKKGKPRIEEAVGPTRTWSDSVGLGPPF